MPGCNGIVGASKENSFCVISCRNECCYPYSNLTILNGCGTLKIPDKLFLVKYFAASIGFIEDINNLGGSIVLPGKLLCNGLVAGLGSFYDKDPGDVPCFRIYINIP